MRGVGAAHCGGFSGGTGALGSTGFGSWSTQAPLVTLEG